MVYVLKKIRMPSLVALVVVSLLLASCGDEGEKVYGQSEGVEGSFGTNNDEIKLEAGDSSFSGRVYGDMVYLSWQVKAGESYRVSRQNPIYQQSFTVLDTVPSNTSFYKDRNLIANHYYYYKLEFCANQGSCTEVGKTLKLKATAPDTPKEAPIITDASYDSVSAKANITWADVPSAHKYTLWRSEITDNELVNRVLLNSSVMKTSAVDSTLELKKRYLYSVKACTSKEKCSGLSNQYPLAVGLNLIADTVLNKQTFNDYKISLSWDKAALADKYEVQRSIDGNPYVFIASLTYNTFIDSLAPGISGVFKYRLRGVSDKWGVSDWVESKGFTLSSSGAASASGISSGSVSPSSFRVNSTSARAGANVVSELPSISLPEPKILITPNYAYAFWGASVNDPSRDYFQIRVNDLQPEILSSENKSARIAYVAGEEIEFYSCSDVYYACNKSFMINTSNLIFPEGQSQQAEVTAQLPDAIGLSWQSKLSEDFVYISEGKTSAFYKLLNPLAEKKNTHSVKITGLEQGKSYNISMLNCQEVGKKSVSLCLNMSKHNEITVPEYSSDIGFSWLQGKWNKGHLPVFSFDDFNGQKPYHLVVDRQCIGLACLDLSQDTSQVLDALDVSGTPAFVTDVLLEDTVLQSIDNRNNSLAIVYTLSLCLVDWTKCSESKRLEVVRNGSTPHIIGLNPASIDSSTPLKIAVSYPHQPEEKPIELHVERSYSDMLSSSPDRNFQQVVRQSYKINDASQKGQVLKVDKVNPFSSSLPWYHYRKKLKVSIESQGKSLSTKLGDEQTFLTQDDLGSKLVEGVARILVANENLTCVQLNDGAVTCFGDSDLVSSFLPKQKTRVPASIVEGGISAPALPTYSLTDGSLCVGTSGSLSRVLSPISKIALSSKSACLINKQGKPVCLNRDNAQESFGAASYFCPLASAVGLNQIKATSEAEHFCSLDSQGGSHCWGNLEAAVPLLQEQTYYSSPSRIHFFRGSDNYPVLDDILTGKDFSCLSLNSEEYCYSQENGWFNKSWPVQISFPNINLAAIDMAAYKGLICWLHSDNNSSYVSCIKSGNQQTAYPLPEGASQVGSDNKIQSFLLAGLSQSVSNKAKLWLTKKAVCVFDDASLWCSGDIGYNDYVYKQQSLLELSEVTLPYKQLHDFAASDDGFFCVSFGSYKRLGCWQSQNSKTSAISSELPDFFWPLMPDSPATNIALAADYSCATFSSSIGCWGRANNPAVSIEKTKMLARATPVMEAVTADKSISQLVVGKTSACYQSNNQWSCWGDLPSLGQWFGLSSYDKAVPISSPISPKFDSDIEAVSLAKHNNEMCVVTSEKSLVYCSENNDTSYEKTSTSELQPHQITDIQGREIIAVGKPVYVGKSACALGRTDNSSPYAVYCWGEKAITGQRHALSNTATKVVDGLTRDSQLLANSNVDASVAYALVYSPSTGIINYWGKHKKEIALPRQATWPIGLRDLSIWPSDDPILLGLTRKGHIYWQSLNQPKKFGSIPNFSPVNSLDIGANNICLRLAESGQLVCAGDNSFGKSGLIEKVMASGISRSE